MARKLVYKLRSTAGRMVIALMMAVLLALLSQGQTSFDQEERVLGRGEVIRRPLSREEFHLYTIKLKQGELFNIKVVQSGLNVAVAIALDSDRGTLLKHVDTARGATGVENLIYVADADDTYIVGVFARNTDSPGSSYELRNNAPVRTREEKLAAAAAFRDAASRAYDKDDFDRSISLNQKAIGLVKGLGPTPELASAYFNLGNGLFSKSRYEEAIEWYRKAIPLYIQLKNTADEAVAYDNIGAAYAWLKKYPQSNAAYRQAIPILVKAGNQLTHASTLVKVAENLWSLQDHAAAIANFEKAASIYADLKRPLDEATTHSRAAGLNFELREFEKAAEGFRRSADLFKGEKDTSNEALMLSNLGLAYANLERIGEARLILEQALKLIADSPSSRTETAIRQVLGEAFFAAGSTADALAQYQLAVKASKLAGDSLLEIGSLRGVGSAYSELGEYQTALKYHLEALAIAEKIKNETEQAIEFGNIALVYSELGKYDRTFEYDFKALAIYQRLKDKRGERVMLNNIGIAYLRLGSLLKARDYIERAAALSRELKNDRETAMMLGNLAAVYTRLKNFEKAIPYFEESMPLFRKFNNHRFAVIIGYYYGALRRERGEYDKAVKLHTEAVELARLARTPKYEARALIELGLDRLARRSPAPAAVSFQEALVVARSVGARDEESAALAGLMEAGIQNKQPQLAIFFGKQSVNLLQATRGEIDKVEKDIQADYVKDNEQTYRRLADLLIAEGRLPEAQQVLGMLKEEELSGFVRRDSKEIESLAKRSDLRANERSAVEKYSSYSDRVTSLAAELKNLDEKRRNLAPGDAFADQARYDELIGQVKDANTAFRVFLEKELAAELGAEKKREIDADRALQGKLKQWGEGTVAIATVLGGERYRVILTTANVQVDGKSEISAADLNRKIFAFREALLNPTADPRPLGKELYDILVKPIENDLAASKAKTLLWSLDGTLRYVPVAALWDGEQYLVEKFQNVVLTSTTRQSLQAEVVNQWNVLGAGVTKASQVTDANTSRKIAFDPLVGVGRELSAITGSRSQNENAPGVTLLDAAFTEQALKQQLGLTVANKRRFNVIHFATHFRLGSDTSDSFLLLGNNAALTLADVADSPEMNLTDVELVTLSACNTGFGGIEAKKELEQNNGKEVDSLAQFIELRGAKSVMATLWAVVDESTALLMGEFYRLRAANPAWTKAEALRKAQIALLTGEKKGSPLNRRRSDPIDMGDSGPKQPSFKADPARPFAHPHYWAPFVMIGNWR